MFAPLDKSHREAVARNLRVVRLQAGERLFERGQKAERFFQVVTGQIKLYRVSAEGNEKIVEIAGPGKLFAEAVMFLENHVYPVNAMALSEAELWAFDSRVFLEQLRGSTALCLRLLADLSARLHTTLNEIDQLTLQNATFRVVSFLLQLLPPGAGNSAQLELPAAKNIIASRVSIKPETFSRILHNLHREGVLDNDGRIIRIHDVAALRRQVEVVI
ncbi:MAG: Crp/Fnr family transcriptional regulator [Candidatus Competibacteraceae bacterium]|nr:Crp/Fnr family transcriptional regulator [Candidatus Competibacteraceae bacterium]